MGRAIIEGNSMSVEQFSDQAYVIINHLTKESVLLSKAQWDLIVNYNKEQERHGV